MTDKPEQRDAEKDLDFVGGITSGFTYPIFEYWIKEAEAQRIRAEAAEQERDKLLQALRNIVAVPVAKSMHNEALILHNIAHKALEGSQPDGE